MGQGLLWRLVSLHWLWGRSIPTSTILWSYASFTLEGQWHQGAVLVWAQARCQVPTLGWKTPAKSSFIAAILSRPAGHRSLSIVDDLSQLCWTIDVRLPFHGERAVSRARGRMPVSLVLSSIPGLVSPETRRSVPRQESLWCTLQGCHVPMFTLTL